MQLETVSKKQMRKLKRIRTEKTTFLEEIKDIKKNKFLFLMTIPGIIFFLVFAYTPMAGLVIAFQRFNPQLGIFGSPFVGFDNFRFFLGSEAVNRVTFNTVYLNLLFMLTGMFSSIAIAVILSEVKGRWFKRITQSVVILPHFMSWAVIAMISVALLSTDTGLINQVIVFFGGDRVNFYLSPELWPRLLVFLRIWRGAGFGSIIYFMPMQCMLPAPRTTPGVASGLSMLVCNRTCVPDVTAAT